MHPDWEGDLFRNVLFADPIILLIGLTIEVIHDRLVVMADHADILFVVALVGRRLEAVLRRDEVFEQIELVATLFYRR